MFKNITKSRNFRIGLGVFLFACCGLSYLNGSQIQDTRATETHIAKFTQVVIAVSRTAAITQTAMSIPTEALSATQSETPIPLPTNTPVPTDIPATTNAQPATSQPAFVAPSNTPVPATVAPTNTQALPTIASSTNTPIPPTNASAQTYYVTSAANIRPCPRTTNDCTFIRQLTSGQTVNVVGQEQGESVNGSTLWYRLDDGNYVHSGVVSLNVPVQAQQSGGGSTSSGGGGFATSAPAPSGSTCSCTANTYNCSTRDFSSVAEAQTCFDFCRSQGFGDVHDLDRNEDGRACETGLNS
jgi:hypothetical protein